MRLNSTAFQPRRSIAPVSCLRPFGLTIEGSEADAFDAVEVRYKGPARYLERVWMGMELAVDDEAPDIMLRSE